MRLYGLGPSPRVTRKKGRRMRVLWGGSAAASSPPSSQNANTVLLLHMNGADASTTFTDSSATTPHTVTAAGNAQIDTAQSKFGGASGLFDGTGDFLTLDGSAEFAFGTGDFTVDFWFRIAVAGTAVLFDGRATGSDPALTPMIYAAANQLRYFTNGGEVISGSTQLLVDTWYHCALTRSGTSTKLFLNGTQEGATYSDSNNYIVGASRPMIGADGNGNGNNAFNGWIDELRVLKGEAAWTSNFTPPTSAYD